MSQESAKQFLHDAINNIPLREKFAEVRTPVHFVDVARELGYTFSTDELEQVVKEFSKGIETRRATGIWPWLRTVPWI